MQTHTLEFKDYFYCANCGDSLMGSKQDGKNPGKHRHDSAVLTPKPLKPHKKKRLIVLWVLGWQYTQSMSLLLLYKWWQRKGDTYVD